MWKDKLSNEENINVYLKKRQQKYNYITVSNFELDEYISKGWIFDKELKKGIKLKQQKSQDVIFENKVWILLAKMGFKIMNIDNQLRIPYKDSLETQIDVFAVDDDTALIVECKSAQRPKDRSFKLDLDALDYQKQGLISSIRKEFPGRKIKIIFAVNDYKLSENDYKRIDDHKFYLMDNTSINYFYELQKHIGMCAKYQFLGTIFTNSKIENMETNVYAIKAYMGKKEYYTFDIEPSKLLKMGYILHRKEGVNSDDLPTYQRLIKKKRLQSVQNFIENDGFFPNSLIVSIEGTPNFKQTKQHDFQSRSKIGVLELPKKYRSIYIIDGQHRLYGYANSSKAYTETIPVVAFYNLKVDEQLKIFVDINENQKSIQKNLVNTLNADLLWDSDSQESIRKALRLRCAYNLAINRKSPLYSMIQIGEEDNEQAKITMQAFDDGISKSRLLNKYKKNILVEHGHFDMNDKEKTKDFFFPILNDFFICVKEEMPEEWNRNDQGILTTNIGIFALIKVFDDIIDFLHNSEGYNPLQSNKNEVIYKIRPYILYLSNFVNEIEDEDREKLRTKYGGNGKTILWRRFQKEIHDRCLKFNPLDLESWWHNHMKVNNDEAFKYLDSLYDNLSISIKERLKDRYGENWLNSGVPLEVNKFLKNAELEYQYKNNGLEVDSWKFIKFEHFRQIMIYKKNWSEIFCNHFAIYLKDNNKKDKLSATEWLIKFTALYEKKSSKSYSVSDEDLTLIKKVCNELM
ncbi:MAG: DGQHR domain-containing protein [[Clostridium] innocuum]|uniref:DGQHR domain-containing protein n=1 Tax=Clostridium sp. TaxID=1506 RepID=UPI003991E78E